MDHKYSLLIVGDSKMNEVLFLSIQWGQGLLEGGRKIRNGKLSPYSVGVP